MKNSFLLSSRADRFYQTISRWLMTNANIPCEQWTGLFHEGSRERIYRIAQPPDGQNFFFMNCFRFQEAARTKVNMRLFSKAWHAYRVSCFLFDQMIPTPEPYGYAIIREGPNRGIEVLFTEWIEDALSLGQFADCFFAESKTGTWTHQKRDLAVRLGKFVRILHKQGVYHGDLNINNILIQSGEELKLYLIDTGDIRSKRWISNRRIMKNLDEVNRFFLDTTVVTRADRLRFLKTYLGAKAENRRILRRYWHKIEQRTNMRLEIHQKRFKRENIASHVD